MQTRPLRRNLILAAVSIFALALLLDRLYEYAVVRTKDIERNQTIYVREMCYALARDYSQLLMTERIRELRLSVAARGTQVLIRQLAVIDDRGTVLASTNLLDQGRSMTETNPFFDPELFRKATDGNRTVIGIGQKRQSVRGYAPISLPPDPDELRSLRRGLLFLEVDMGQLKAASWQNLFSLQNLLRWLLTFFLAGLLLGFLLKRQLFRPLRHLEEVTSRLGKGDWEARSRLQGRGELARLGDVLNEMRRQIMTERRSLLESEARFRGLVETSPLPMLVISPLPESAVMSINRRFTELFGYTVYEVPSMAILWPRVCPDPDYRKEVQRRWAEAIEKAHAQGLDRIEPLTAEVSCRDGQVRFVELHMALQSDRSLLVFNDLTGRRSAELELELAKTDAESANRAKSVFLANMSHELRTPLNAILGFSEMLGRDRDTSADQQEKLAVINRSGEHLLSMINDVLDLSKIEAGRMELERSAFDLPQMMEEISRIFGVRAKSAGLRFQLELDPALVRYIKADIGKLRQILINLLGNAVKFTREGGFSLCARTQSIWGDNDRVTLQMEVQDSGPGIPSEQLQNIFEPFIQAGQSPMATSGSGLGLAITRSFIELMGGEISVESKVGKGALFRVQLPVALADTAKTGAIEVVKPAVSGLAPGQAEWRILVVEDNIENRLLLSGLLEQAGFEIREAGNGEEAISLFEQWQPHFIWMDMRLPVMDGYEAIEKIRSMPKGDKVKIVAITASAFKEQRENILETGCDDMVYKPFKSHEIFDAMEKQLGVRYIYEEEVEREPGEPEVTLTSELLTELPDELRQALREAAHNLDISATDDVIKEIRSKRPEIADGLQLLAKEFHFERILELLGERENND